MLCPVVMDCSISSAQSEVSSASIEMNGCIQKSLLLVSPLIMTSPNTYEGSGPNLAKTVPGGMSRKVLRSTIFICGSMGYRNRNDRSLGRLAGQDPCRCG